MSTEADPKAARLGVIGGSGVYEMEGVEVIAEYDVETPFGKPSDKIVHGRIGEREVFFELNGQPRSIRVADAKAEVTTVVHEKADPSDAGSVGAPMPGVVVELRVAPGAVVEAGAPLVVLSAMKMETVVGAPVAGRISRLGVVAGDSLAAGDLLAVITPQDAAEAV